MDKYVLPKRGRLIVSSAGQDPSISEPPHFLPPRKFVSLSMHVVATGDLRAIGIGEPGLNLDEPAFFEVVSVSPRPLVDIGSRVAEVLERAGRLAPDMGALSARTRKLGENGLQGLVDTAVDQPRSDGLWMVFEQRRLQLWGDLRIVPETRLETAPRFHEVGFRVPLREVQADEALREDAVQLLCDLFVAIDGFYGRADSAAMSRRRLDFRTAAADEGRMWIPRWSDPKFVIYDRWVEDVWWLNLYGPAYIDRWGWDMVEGLGVRSMRLANGGAAVWSCKTPPEPAAADSITGYAHKSSFYEALGQQTFIHESLEIPEPGVRVPFLWEHARSRPSALPAANG